MAGVSVQGAMISFVSCSGIMDLHMHHDGVRYWYFRNFGTSGLWHCSFCTWFLVWSSFLVLVSSHLALVHEEVLMDDTTHTDSFPYSFGEYGVWSEGRGFGVGGVYTRACVLGLH
jgi:hypothetical protein